ncbi:MAG: PrsW family glutamic-type intramembrane protease [Methanomicrobiales archaeon]|nr:PrsW family glutamic-type intramembrane protease [Methanomicrobiales archaeon]
MEGNVWVIGFIAIAPGIFWLWYFYHKDRFEPEPLPLIFKIYLLGAMVTFPALLLEYISDLFVTGLLAMVIAAPIIEESCKFCIVRRSVFAHREFDEPLDGIIYAVSAALGFATLENVIYIFFAPTFTDVLQIGTVRALLSVPGHALFAVPWGYAMGIAKFRTENRHEGVILGGLLTGMLFHGLFNFLLMGELLGFAILMLVAFPIMWISGESRIKDLLTRGR